MFPQIEYTTLDIILFFGSAIVFAIALIKSIPFIEKLIAKISAKVRGADKERQDPWLRGDAWGRKRR